MFFGRRTHKVIEPPMSASASSIAELATRAREDLPASFEAAYHQHADTVARWAQQLGGSSVDVDDVVQEVFLVVSRQLGRFRGEARFSTWLFEVTRKITANHRRRHRWRFWRSSAERRADCTAHDQASQALMPDAELERRQAVAQLYQALDKLPEKYRTVLVLYEIDGLSTQEIANLRQLNLSTARVHLARARACFMKHYRQLLKKGQP
jgi:RNA polymerase sigma-70 factor (ECF subfamily)